MSSQPNKNISTDFLGNVDGAIASYVREQAGNRLPGERALSEQFGISRPRLRSILRQLQSDGLVEARHGSGTYAIDPTQPRLRTLSILVDEQLKLGEDPFFSYLFDQIQRACQAAHLHSHVRRIGNEPTSSAALFDGAITIGASGRRIVEDHADTTSAIVALMPGVNVRPKGRVSVVQCDDIGAGRIAANGLIEIGCPEIVFVGRLDLDASRLRYEGVCQACDVARVRHRVIESHLNYPAGLATGQRLGDEGCQQIGVIAMNDWLAVGLRAGMDSRGTGRTFPIMSFDGLPVAAEPSLAIHSLRVPVDVIAADAVNEIVRLHSSRASVGRTLVYELEHATTAVL